MVFNLASAQNCSQSNPDLACFNSYDSNLSSVGCSTSNSVPPTGSINCSSGNCKELLPDLTVSWWMMQEYGSILGKGPLEYPTKDRLGVDLFVPNIGDGPILSVAKGEFLCVNAAGNPDDDCVLECNTSNCTDSGATISAISCPCAEEFQKEKVYQRILVKDGDDMKHYDKLIGYQSFHNGHNHFHVDNWVELTLRVKTNDDLPCT